MSENIWGEESPYNDTLEYDSDTRSFKEPEPGFVPKSPPRQRSQVPVQQPAQQEQFVEEVLQEMADDEEEDTQALSDAALRLEQGRLYQMVMNHNLFEGMDADPRAIKNVQRQIRKFARESMEVMLGMRQTTPAHIQSAATPQFNDLEVQALKMLAAKVTGGKSEQGTSIAPKATVKKDLTPIGGSTKSAKSPAPVAPKTYVQQTKLQNKPTVPIQRQQAQPEDSALTEINTVMNGKLTKNISDMTAEELVEYNREVSERQSARKAKATNALPMPTADQEEMLHTQRANVSAPAISAIIAALNNSKKQ